MERNVERVGRDDNIAWSTGDGKNSVTIGELLAAKQEAEKANGGKDGKDKDAAEKPADDNLSAVAPPANLSPLQQKLAQLKRRAAAVPPPKSGAQVVTTTEEVVKSDITALQATIRLLVEERALAAGMSPITRATKGISLEKINAALEEALVLPSSGDNAQIRQLLSAAASAAYIEAMAAKTGPSREEINALMDQLSREKFLRISTREESDISIIGRPVRLTSRDECGFIEAALQAFRALMGRNSQHNAEQDKALMKRFEEVAKHKFSEVEKGEPGYFVVPVEISPVAHNDKKKYVVRGSILVYSTGGNRPQLSIAVPLRAGVNAPWTSRLERFFAPAAGANVRLLASSLADEKPSVEGERLPPEVWRSVWNLFNALKRLRAICGNRQELLGKATGLLENFWGNWDNAAPGPGTLFFDYGVWRVEREVGNRKIGEWIPNFFGLIERDGTRRLRVKFAEHLAEQFADHQKWLEPVSDFSKIPGIAGQIIRRSCGTFRRLQEEQAASARELAEKEKKYGISSSTIVPPVSVADAERIEKYPEVLKPPPGLNLGPEDIWPPITKKTALAVAEGDEATDEAADNETAAPRGGKRVRKPAKAKPGKDE